MPEHLTGHLLAMGELTGRVVMTDGRTASNG
jgi:hypothetical protein